MSKRGNARRVLVPLLIDQIRSGFHVAGAIAVAIGIVILFIPFGPDGGTFFRPSGPEDPDYPVIGVAALIAVILGVTSLLLARLIPRPTFPTLERNGKRYEPPGPVRLFGRAVSRDAITYLITGVLILGIAIVAFISP